MRDVPSARLMKIKARCLCAAGVLPRALRERIDGAANRLILADCRPSSRAAPSASHPTLPHHG